MPRLEWRVVAEPVIWRKPILAGPTKRSLNGETKQVSHKPRLLVNGYNLNLDYENKNGDLAFQCSFAGKSRSGCLFRVKIRKDAPTTLKVASHHNCDSQLTAEQIAKELKMDAMRERQSENLHEVPSQIIGHAGVGPLEELVDASRTADSIYRALNRTKAAVQGYGPDPMTKAFPSPTNLTLYDSGGDEAEQILIHDTGPAAIPDDYARLDAEERLERWRGTNRIIIFAYRDGMDLLCGEAAKERTILADGTFSTTPSLFAQYVFATLKNKFPHMQPARLVTDFEASIFGSFKKVFPMVEEVKCWFHFRSALRKRAQMLGLCGRLRVCNSRLRKQYLMVVCLAYVEPDYVPEFWEALMESKDGHGVRYMPAELDEFLRYFGRVYVGRVYKRHPSVLAEPERSPVFLPRCWNQLHSLLNDLIQTQNPGEAGNRTFLAHIGARPSIHKFASRLTSTVIGKARTMIAEYNRPVAGAGPAPADVRAVADLEAAAVAAPVAPGRLGELEAELVREEDLADRINIGGGLEEEAPEEMEEMEEVEEGPAAGLLIRDQGIEEEAPEEPAPEGLGRGGIQVGLDFNDPAAWGEEEQPAPLQRPPDLPVTPPRRRARRAPQTAPAKALRPDDVLDDLDRERPMSPRTKRAMVLLGKARTRRAYYTIRRAALKEYVRDRDNFRASNGGGVYVAGEEGYKAKLEYLQEMAAILDMDKVSRRL